jgi:hypothetical protein
MEKKSTDSDRDREEFVKIALEQRRAREKAKED